MSKFENGQPFAPFHFSYNKFFIFRAVPEELFFTNGACLCLTVLDHDVMSYDDLAGQAFLPLAGMTKLKSLSAKQLPSPLVVPLQMPANFQHNEHSRFLLFHQTFTLTHRSVQILEQRSQRDALAKEMTAYEKYLRDYRILPPSAHDNKEEWSKGLKESLSQMARSKHHQLKQAVGTIF
uniref:Uncharacterized protein n=1 Tax=Ditylenchus dipsaci TaxID=166011 RepID=A0A915EUH2_9BILA